jgi:hypothetical protein
MSLAKGLWISIRHVRAMTLMSETLIYLSTLVLSEKVWIVVQAIGSFGLRFVFSAWPCGGILVRRVFAEKFLLRASCLERCLCMGRTKHGCLQKPWLRRINIWRS